MKPHLEQAAGRAADFAAHLAAQLPRIETARTVLRAPDLSDAPHWIEIALADEGGHLGGPFNDATAFTDFAATVGLWLLRGHGLWTVTDHAGAVLGFVLLGFEPGDEEPELGWLFRPEARGRGLATEAAAAARDHALGPLAMPALSSCIDATNAASRRLAQRLGARFDRMIVFDGTDTRVELWRHDASTGSESA